MGKLRHLSLLIWKNFTLQKRRPIGTLVQIGLPFFMSLIYLAIRLFLVEADHKGAVVWPPYGINNLPKNFPTSFQIGYSTAPGLNLSQDFLSNLTRNLAGNVMLTYFKSESEMASRLSMSDSSNFTCGIYFSSMPNISSKPKFEYSIRFLSRFNTKNKALQQFVQGKNGWVTKFVFLKFQLPEPRNKNL